MIAPHRGSPAHASNNRTSRLGRLLGVLLVVLGGAAGGRGQTTTGQSPLQPGTAGWGSVATANNFGLNMTIDSTWLRSPGYQPICLSVSPMAPVTADRTLVVEVTSWQAWGQETLLVEQTMLIPAGTAKGQAIETVLAVPPLPDWCEIQIRIVDPALPSGPAGIMSDMQARGLYRRSPQQANLGDVVECPRILLVGDRLPETAALGECFPMWAAAFSGQTPVYQQVAEDRVASGPLPSVMAVPPAKMPRRWIELSGMDVVCVSVDRLAELAERHKEAHGALLAWTAAGGNLWVYGVAKGDDRWGRLGEVERLLRLPPPSEPAEPGQKTPAGWRRPDPALFGKLDPSRQWDAAMGRGMGVPVYDPYGNPVLVPMPQDVPEKLAKKEKPPRAPREPGFLLRTDRMGTIAAISAANPLAGPTRWTKWEWDWLLASLGSDRWGWCARHGLVVGRESPDFWDFVVPGVGLAPVREFQILITLFVLAIGPANYWLLRRKGRLHLMVLTVPASALVVTFLLFAYAILSDGLGTRVRVRSVTLLDSKRGEAVTWARLSYYTGLAPSDGLTFSEDVAVYPILSESDVGGNASSRKEMLWDTDQRLLDGWLRSRTPTQYLTVRSAPSQRTVRIAPLPGAKSALGIENRLGVPIDGLAACAADGTYYWAANVGEGATVRAGQAKPAEVFEWLAVAVGQNVPRIPPEMGDVVRFGGRRTSSRYYYQTAYLSTSPELARLHTSRLERTLDRLNQNASAVLKTSPVWPAPNSIGPALAPGRFVALVPRSPEVELGTDAAREEGSFHVIMGEW